MWTLLTSVALAVPRIDAFVACAVGRDADVAAAHAAVVAARGAIREARGPFENPELQVGAAVVGGLVQGSVVQPVSPTGAGRYARRAADAGAARATAEARLAELTASASARSLWASWAATDGAVRLSDLELEGAERVRAAAERRRDAGEATDLDVHLARLAEADAVASALADRGARTAVRRAVAMACPSALADAPTIDEAVPAPTARPVERLDLAAANARAEEAQAQAHRERAAAVPAIGLGAFFQVDPAHGDPGDLGPQVTWTVPLWRRNQAGVDAATGAVAVATSAVSRAAAGTGPSVEAARRNADEALSLSARLPTGDDDVSAVLTSVEAAYAIGELDLATALQLRAQALTGARSVITARQAVAEAQLAALLAEEDAALLGSTAEGEAR